MNMIKLLILEDNKYDAQLLIEHLKRGTLTFEYVVIEKGSEIVDCINTNNPDIVLSDFTLPDTDGFSIINTVNRIDRHLPVVIVTGSIDEETAVECIKAGASDYILKENLVRLESAIISAIEKVKSQKWNEENNRLIQKSEQIYRALFEEAADAIFIGDYEGKFMMFNNSAISLTGFTQTELHDMNMSELFADAQNMVLPLNYSDLKKGISVLNERLLVTKSGDLIHVEMNSQLLNAASFLCVMRNISSRKKIESDIAEYQERLKSIIEHSSNLFYAHDIGGSFTYVSPQTAMFFGCEPDELIQKKELYYPDCAVNKKAKDHTKVAIETGVAQSPFMIELLKSDGTKKWAEVHEAPVEKDGKVTGVVGALVDITNWKLTSERLIASEEKFRRLFEDAPDGILHVDIKGNVLDCNTAFCSLIGKAKTKIVGLHIADVCESHELSLYSDNFEKLKKYSNITSEVPIISGSGIPIYTRRNASAMYDENGEFQGAIIHIHDISEQKKAQRDIQVREEQLTSLINASPDNICFRDNMGRWQLCNSANLKFFSIENCDYFGKTTEELIPLVPNLKSVFEYSIKTDEKAWAKKEVFQDEHIVDVGDSERIFSVLKVPLFYSDGSRKAMIEIARDITVSRKIEMTLRQSQKMEAIGLMAAGIAHNFNNIIQAIIGYVDFAQAGLEIDTQRYNDISEIKKLVGKATSLTKELMAVGKDRFLHKNEFLINDIITPLIGIINHSSNSVTIDYLPDDNLPLVNADGSQIDQVLLNVLFNARDAMPNGGIITLKTSFVVIDSAFCKLNSWAEVGRYICVSVADKGIGMNEDVLSRIFEPYFTTKSVDKGTGLGLSVSFGIISQHNGLVNVESVVDEGTTFNIYLPVD